MYSGPTCCTAGADRFRLTARPTWLGLILWIFSGSTHPAWGQPSPSPLRPVGRDDGAKVHSRSCPTVRGGVALAPPGAVPSEGTVVGATGLLDFRTTLDNLDAVLLRLLAERSRTTRKVRDYRRRHHLPARDEAAEQLELQTARELARASGLDPELVQRLFNMLSDPVSSTDDAASSRRTGGASDRARTARTGTRLEGRKRRAPELDLQATLANLDAALVRLLAERFRTTQKVGEYKRQHGLPARDEARENAQLERARGLAASVGLDPEIAGRVFRLVFDAVVANHERLRKPPSGATAAPK
jgi:chorismate mutase